MKFLLILTCLIFHSSLSCVTKLKIDIFYESLCPFSVLFLSTQLQPIYEDFKHQLDITFVPFGKSNQTKNEDGSVGFVCQHGPDECFGNKVQGCMLARFPDQDMQTAYVTCQMQFPDPNNRTYKDPRICVEQFGKSYDNDILKCVEGDEATKQQLYFETLTTPVLTIRYGVPTITINGEINYDSRDLKEILCEHLEFKNEACNRIEAEKKVIRI